MRSNGRDPGNTGDAVSQSGQPVADRWRIQISFDGAPAKLRAKVTREAKRCSNAVMSE